MFSLKYYRDGPYLDGWLDVSAMLAKNTLAEVTAAKLQQKDFPPGLAYLTGAVQGMEMRARFDTSVDGPYLVKTDGPVSSQHFSAYIRGLKPAALTTFLQGALYGRNQNRDRHFRGGEPA
jgi:hypothetical protein